MKSIYIFFSIFFFVIAAINSSYGQLNPSFDGVFAVCPNQPTTYSISNPFPEGCIYDWTVTNGSIQGGIQIGNESTFSGSGVISITWFNVTNSGQISVSSRSCNNANGNLSLTRSIPILSINGVNPGAIDGAPTVTVNTTGNQVYSIPQINFPNTGSGNPNPFQVNGYEWEIPQGWTVVSGGNTRSITVRPDNCSGGIIRVRGRDTSCSAGPFYTNWSSKSITRTLQQPGLISGPDQLNCSDTTPRTYSVNPVAGAESYTWTIPSGWSGSSTTTSITVTPNGLNGGTITVKANGCSIQSSPASKPVTINLTDPGNPPAISGSTPVCYMSNPLNGTDFTLSNLPQNSTVAWSVSSNLTIVSGQGTTSLRVNAISSSTSGAGWVEALITTPCGSPPAIRYDVWIGKPYDFYVFGPTIVAANSIANQYSAAIWNGQPSFADQGVTDNGFSWYFGHPPTSNGWNCFECTGQTILIQAGSQSTIVTGEVTNACGSTIRNYEVFVECPSGDCEEPFIIYPNPASDEFIISTSLKDTEGAFEVILTDSQGVVVYKMNVETNLGHIKVPVMQLKSGVYFLRMKQGGRFTQKQIIINH